MEPDGRIEHRLALDKFDDPAVLRRVRPDCDDGIEPRGPRALQHARQVIGQPAVSQVRVRIDGKFGHCAFSAEKHAPTKVGGEPALQRDEPGSPPGLPGALCATS